MTEIEDNTPSQIPNGWEFGDVWPEAQPIAVDLQPSPAPQCGFEQGIFGEFFP